jgi:cytochrome b
VIAGTEARAVNARVAGRTILVWDLPVRVFHGLLAGAFAAAFATGDADRWRDVHAVLGYTILALVVFRLAWGVFGTRHARFGAFPLAPAAALAYVRSLLVGRPAHHPGHNPAGAVAIYLLLALALAAGLSGLAAYAGHGGKWAEEVHEALANTMLAVVVVHVAGVVVGSVAHRENLALAMLTGRKHGAPESAIDRARPLVAAALLAGVLGLWTGILPTPGLALEPGLGGNAATARADRDTDDD